MISSDGEELPQPSVTVTSTTRGQWDMQLILLELVNLWPGRNDEYGENKKMQHPMHFWALTSKSEPLTSRNDDIIMGF